jgi:hypothetical protein
VSKLMMRMQEAVSRTKEAPEAKVISLIKDIK